MPKENKKAEKLNEIQIAYVAKADCKKCFGRGYLGREIHTNKYVPCKCLRAIQLPKDDYNKLDHKDLHV